jgi:hypothetical protein
VAANDRARQSIDVSRGCAALDDDPGRESGFGLGVDFGVLIAITTAFILLASRLYPRIVQ